MRSMKSRSTGKVELGWNFFNKLLKRVSKRAKSRGKEVRYSYSELGRELLSRFMDYGEILFYSFQVRVNRRNTSVGLVRRRLANASCSRKELADTGTEETPRGVHPLHHLSRKLK